MIYFAGALLVYIANKVNAILRDLIVALTGLTPIVIFFLSPQFEAFGFNMAGFDLVWNLTSFSYIFEMLVVIMGGASLLYSIPYMKGKENLGFFLVRMLDFNARF